MDLTDGRSLKGGGRLQGTKPREDPKRLPEEQW